MQYTILAAIIAGSVLSQLLPYFRKVSEGKINSFDFKYAYNLGVAALWSSLLAIPFYTTWSVPEGDAFIVHLLALLFGYGGNKLQAEGMKYYKLFTAANVKEALEQQ